MGFSCVWDAKKKQKRRKLPTHQEGAVLNTHQKKNIEVVGTIRSNFEECKVKHETSTRGLATLSISDIIALNSEFRKVLQEYVDLSARKNFVAIMKSVVSEMMLENFNEKNLKPEVKNVAFLQRFLKELPPVRMRLALAIQRFCTVVEQELENDELMQETGFLEVFHRGITQEEPQAGKNCSSAKETTTIGPAANFDALKIYHQVIKTDELPSLEEMAELMRRTSKLLREEANIVLVSLPCVVVGDIHGQKHDLVGNIIAAAGQLDVDSQAAKSPAEDDMEVVGKRNYLFLGDYVDRGPHSLHCIALLFAAKLLAPHRVFLLRGNHESSDTNSRYGFLQECYEKYPIVSEGGGKDCSDVASEDYAWDLKEHPLWVLANEAFINLPLCAIVTDSDQSRNEDEKNFFASSSSNKSKIAICAMHGGLSPFISDSLDGIVAIDRFRVIEYGPLADITWADPIVTRPETCAEKIGDVDRATTATATARQGNRQAHHCVAFNYDNPVPITSASVGYVYSARGRGRNFGEDVTLRFLRENELSFIIRAHQCVKEGYEWQHHQRLLTLFSAPNYCGLGNKGAILILHANGEPELVQFEAIDDFVASGAEPIPVPPGQF